MNFYDYERAALFIDGADLDATTKALGFHVDFKKLLELFRSQTRLVRATYYALYPESQEYSPVRPLVDWLGYNGYLTVSKPAKEIPSATGHRFVANSMAVELAIDAIQLAPSVDHIVLFSGSADFRSLIAAIQKLGRRATVVSSRRAAERSVSDELRRQGDQFLELADLQGRIALEVPAGPIVERTRSRAPSKARAKEGTTVARAGDDTPV
jgi:uncharacterized LabA/DUF88 family protein